MRKLIFASLLLPCFSVPAFAAPSATTDDLGALSKNLAAGVFKGAQQETSTGSLLTAKEKVLRRPNTKERTVLPEQTRLTQFYAQRLSSGGEDYVVTLWIAETATTDVPGGGAAVLAVFPQDGKEPLDVVEVKTDQSAFFDDTAIPGTEAIGAFMVSNAHHNSNQGYLDSSLFHIYQGRLRLIDSIFTLSSQGGCEDFDEALSWKAAPKSSSPYPELTATVTLTKNPSPEEMQCDQPQAASSRAPQTFTQIYRWNPAKQRYIGAGKDFERLQHFNQNNL